MYVRLTASKLLKKFETLNSIEGTFDYDNRKYDFAISGLSNGKGICNLVIRMKERVKEWKTRMKS